MDDWRLKRQLDESRQIIFESRELIARADAILHQVPVTGDYSAGGQELIKEPARPTAKAPAPPCGRSR